MVQEYTPFEPDTIDTHDPRTFRCKHCQGLFAMATVPQIDGSCVPCYDAAHKPKRSIFPQAVRELHAKRKKQPVVTRADGYTEVAMFDVFELPWLIGKTAQHWWRSMPMWLAIPVRVVAMTCALVLVIGGGVWLIMWPFVNADWLTEPGMPLAFMRYTESETPGFYSALEQANTAMSVGMSFLFGVPSLIGLGVAAYFQQKSVRQRGEAGDM